MTQGTQAAFFSYCREDSEFALKLAGDLKAAGASVWLDQLDITLGQRWDRAVEDALKNCSRLVVVLSPASVNSENVMDEVNFALEEKKAVIPIIYRDCEVPFRLRRMHHVDFRRDYAHGLRDLIRTLAPGQTAGQGGSTVLDVRGRGQSGVAHADDSQHAAEQVRLEEEPKQAAEQARAEQDHGRAVEEARVEDERRTAQTLQEKKLRQTAENARAEQGNPTAEEIRAAWLPMLYAIPALAFILLLAFVLWFVFHDSQSLKPQKPTVVAADLWNIPTISAANNPAPISDPTTAGASALARTKVRV